MTLVTLPPRQSNFSLSTAQGLTNAPPEVCVPVCVSVTLCVCVSVYFFVCVCEGNTENKTECIGGWLDSGI